MNKIAIIVAGGKGVRLGSNLPKQFLDLEGKPIFVRSIEKFLDFDEIILALPADYIDFAKDVLEKFNITNVKCVKGGYERFFSVKYALEAIDAKEGIVAIHDAVRPFVSKKTIELGLRIAQINGTAVPVIKPSSSVRIAEENDLSIRIDREKVRLVQTPQFFELNLLKSAYEVGFSVLFTDDASVVENYGAKITIFEGEEFNIKITTQLDFEIAKILAQKNY